MRKLVISYLFLTINVGLVSCQFQLSFKAGPNYSKIIGPSARFIWDTGYKLGANTEIGISYKIPPRIKFKVGLAYDFQRFYLNGYYGDKFESHHDDGVISAGYLVTLLEPHVILAESINLELVTGMYFSHLLNAKLDGYRDNKPFNSNITDDFHGGDDGFLIGLGYYPVLNQNTQIIIDLIYSRSLQGLELHSESIKNQSFRLCIGLLFSIHNQVLNSL